MYVATVTATVTYHKKQPTADGKGWTWVVDRQEQMPVRVELDVEGIAQKLAHRIVRSRAGKSSFMGGLVVARKG
jgi:hypothetical protein